MSELSQLEKLKLMLGISADDKSEDSLLTLFLSNAEQLIINTAYPFQEADVTYLMPPRYNQVQLETAMRMYNMQGAEGETSHSENGVNRSYESINDYVAMNVKPFCGVPKAVSAGAQS